MDANIYQNPPAYSTKGGKRNLGGQGRDCSAKTEGHRPVRKPSICCVVLFFGVGTLGDPYREEKANTPAADLVPVAKIPVYMGGGGERG